MVSPCGGTYESKFGPLKWRIGCDFCDGPYVRAIIVNHYTVKLCERCYQDYRKSMGYPNEDNAINWLAEALKEVANEATGLNKEVD